jgi:hypothetical protein
LWEDYAIKFITYTKEKTDVGATIIAMKYAKIKPEGIYESFYYKFVIVKHGSVKMIAVRTKYITSCDLWFIN